MNPSPAINELQAFQATPRRREKPTVPLTNVLILSTVQSAAPVDLFDALFKGPFSATGTYIHDGTCKLRCTQPSPCLVQMSNVEKFAIEENADVDPASVKIYFEGTLAWYQIISPHPSYASTFADMKLKAEIWLWIQHRRSNSLHRTPSLYARTPRNYQRWPTLGQIRRDLPPHFTSRTFDPIDAFHPYFIERIIQSHLSEETLAVGPEGVQPQWMESSLAKDLENAYPAIWRSIYDRVEVTVNQGWAPRSHQQAPLSPISMRAKVQKPSKETRILQQLFLVNAAEVKNFPDLASAAQLFLTPPQPWHNFTHLELLEKIENHAEALLSDSAFVNTFQGWSGIDEIKAFCTDKKWWKHRRVSQIKRRGQGRPRLSQESSYESSVPPRSRSLESASADLPQDDNLVDLTAETPTFPKTAKKGTSILRPRFSIDHTPGTPTKQGDSQSDMLVDSEPSTDDDELQLSQIPPDVSTRIHGENKPLTRRKRKIESPIENPNHVKQPSRGFEFGRGRPPLTTVPIPLPSNGRTTVFHCPFPSCSYTRLNSTSAAAKAEIDKHHRTHRNEIRDALDMLKDPFIVGGRVGGEKGNRLIRPIGGIEHLIDRIEEMAKDLGGTPSKQVAV